MYVDIYHNRKRKRSNSEENKKGFNQYVKIHEHLKYQNVDVGKGQEAKKGDKVYIHFVAKVKGGEIFENSSGGKPLGFKLGSPNVIPGLAIGIEGMKVGGSRKLEIQPQLGYGAKSVGNGKIPPNSVLEFSIKLMKLKKIK